MKPKNWKKYLKITHIQPITRALKIDAQFCINTQLLRPETNILSKINQLLSNCLRLKCAKIGWTMQNCKKSRKYNRKIENHK